MGEERRQPGEIFYYADADQVIEQSRQELVGRERRQENQAAKPDVGSEHPKRTATVLLSYVGRNSELANELVSKLQLRLKLRGLRIEQDKKNAVLGDVKGNKVVKTIEHDVDALVLFLTPESLMAASIWEQVVQAALSHHGEEETFQIFPILCGVSIDDFEQWCIEQKWPFLASFTANEIGDVQEKLLDAIAGNILQAALIYYWQNVKMGDSYEPYFRLLGYPPRGIAVFPDLDLDWAGRVGEDGRSLVAQDWDRFFKPALSDVRKVVGERSRVLHLYMKCQLSLAVTFGFFFRDTTGIELILERDKGEPWRTDVELSEERPCDHDPQDVPGDGQIAVVEVVALSRGIEGDKVKKAIDVFNLMPGRYRRLVVPFEGSEGAVKNAAHAKAIARQVGQVCRELCDRWSARKR